MSPLAPVSYYHIWAGDRYHGSAWQTPAVEHFAALNAAQFTGEVRAGITGGQSERLDVIRLLREACPQSQVVVQADEGFEQVTLGAMHQWAKEADPGTPVYYAHTKGALQDTPGNARWRRAMDDVLLGGWEGCVKSLHDYDAAGMHWLTHDDWPEFIGSGTPIFGGNFWWANAGYLAKLEPAGLRSRWDAEAWVGSGSPRVLNLKPGWPDYRQEV